MAFETLNLGLTITIPTSGTRNWAQTLKQTTWTKISQHAHTGGGDGNQLGASSFADFALGRDKLNKALGIYPQPSALVPSGGTQTIDFALGSIATLDLGSASGDVGVTLSNPITGITYRILIIQGATARDVVWPASVKWPQGQKPIITETNDAIDMVTLYYDGTNYFGSWNSDFT